MSRILSILMMTIVALKVTGKKLQKMVPGSPTEREFRVFIRNNVLVGISQREVNTFYSILTEKKHDMEKVIDEFYMDKLPLLFTWAELESAQLMREPEFRIVESRFGVRPGLKTAVPYGYLDTSEGSGWDRLFRNADEELRRQTRSAGGC
ncbi:putative Cell division cycle protein [Helianthus annuus]|nr:putative Cell division cycle protein [Helianthus annuus]